VLGALNAFAALEVWSLFSYCFEEEEESMLAIPRCGQLRYVKVCHETPLPENCFNLRLDSNP
jgi:hypothetical protein